jgi:thymidylate synthase ThyX
MSLNRKVYLLDPQKLPPETIAVTFAKTSRSPLSFQEIADELTDEKSAAFHEKWVVGYGHSSVAEHAVLHIAVENVSRLAVECLESNRLASYTEKSTRYQKWGINNFHIPQELLQNQKLSELYSKTNLTLFEVYLQSLPVVRKEIEKSYPIRNNENEDVWERRIRSQYVDVCRYLLPASALANVGMTINARALEHAVRKMLSHPLAEVRNMGSEIKAVSQNNVPTLVKYADEVPYLRTVAQKFIAESPTLPEGETNPEWCKLVSFDQDIELIVLAALMVRFGNSSFDQNLDFLKSLSPKALDSLKDEVTSQLGKYDIPVRELEYGSYTFDLLMDQGAYFEIKRHRMMTQTAQSLSTLNGYSLPKTIVDAGFEKEYHRAMALAHQAYLEIAEWNPAVASYIVPNAYNRRLLLKANLRSLDHLCNLRTAENAHFSVRRITQRIAEEIDKTCPIAGRWVRRNPNETWQGIEGNYFSETFCYP